MKYYITFAILCCYSLSVFATDTQAVEAHVSDDISINYRSGPSTKYRVKGTLVSGDSVTIVDSRSSRLFYKIKTQQDKLGWVPREQIATGLSNLAKLEMLENSLADSIDLVKKQADEIDRLKSSLSIQKTKNADYTDRQDLLTSRITHLKHKINSLDDSNLIRWITNLGMICLFAIFLFFIISTLKKRKHYNHIL